MKRNRAINQNQIETNNKPDNYTRKWLQTHTIMSEIQIDPEKLVISHSELNTNSKNRPYHNRPIPNLINC